MNSESHNSLLDHSSRGRDRILMIIVTSVLISLSVAMSFFVALLIETLSRSAGTAFDIPPNAFDVVIEVLSVIFGLVIAIILYFLSKIEEYEDKLEKGAIDTRRAVMLSLTALRTQKELFIELSRRIAVAEKEGKKYDGPPLEITSTLESMDRMINEGAERLRITDRTREELPTVTTAIKEDLMRFSIPAAISFGIAILLSSLGYVINTDSTFLYPLEIETDRFFRIFFIISIIGPVVQGVWLFRSMIRQVMEILDRFRSGYRAMNNMAYRNLKMDEFVQDLKAKLVAIKGI